MSKKNKTLDSLAISSKPRCNCSCVRCHEENEFLRNKLIELYAILDKKITGQSLNSAVNRSLNENQTNYKQPSLKGCKCKTQCTKRCGCFKNDFVCGKNCQCDKTVCKNLISEKSEEESDDADKTKKEPLAPGCSVTEVKTDNKVPMIEAPKTNGDLLIPEQDENFDPMKPTRELPRSPLIRKDMSEQDTSIFRKLESTPRRSLILSNLNVSVLNTPPRLTNNELPEELQQPVVDWEKHKAELKECKKCHRKFLPDRLKKHAAVCIKI